MKGSPSDWEYENPTRSTDASHMAFTSSFLFLQRVSLPSTPLAFTKTKDSVHRAEGLMVHLTNMLSDVISAIHRYTYTDAQKTYCMRFLPKHWPSNSQ